MIFFFLSILFNSQIIQNIIIVKKKRLSYNFLIEIFII